MNEMCDKKINKMGDINKKKYINLTATIVIANCKVHQKELVKYNLYEIIMAKASFS